MSDNDVFFDLIFSLWDKSSSFATDIQTFYDYWDGKYNAPANFMFQDQKKTNSNIVKEIVETKLNALLDAQFTIAVFPAVNPLADINTIKDQQSYADILDSELQNVLYENEFDDIKEKVARWGSIAGFGPIQTTFDKAENIEGKIKLSEIDPKTLRFDKAAKSFDELSLIAYEIDINPMIAKSRYGRNPDGTYDEYMCKKIDELAKDKGDLDKGKKTGIVAVQENTTNTTDLAFVRDKTSLKAGKSIKLVVMYLMDDSVAAPEENDSAPLAEEKQELTREYPDGRIIIFAPDKTKKLILDDKAAPKGFKNLGNIDFYNPLDFDKLIGRGDVEDIMPIQDRINGIWLKIRQLISQQINSIVLDDSQDIGIQEGDLVSHAVLKLTGAQGREIQILNNQSIEQAVKLLQVLEILKKEARETARINETMLNGERQVGTTSADQVDALQESPMASIRGQQRNFKSMVIRVGQKILELIHEYYVTSRLIKLATGIYVDGGKEAKYAQMRQTKDEQGNDEQYVDLIDEANKVCKTITVDKEWKFKIDVTSGTNVPRSRRESAQLLDVMFNEGTLGDKMNLDIREQYLRAKDVPNYRAFIAIQKRAQQQLAQNPPKVQLMDILSDPKLAQGFADILKGLELNSKAKNFVLQTAGFPKEVCGVDTLQDAPAQAVSSKADIKDVAAIDPSSISTDPAHQQKGQLVAGAIIAAKHKNEGGML